MLVHPAAATCPFSMRSVARERAGGSQGRGHITSPSPGLQGPHGQAAWPAGAEVEAAPARRVPVAPLALRDGAPGAVVALEAGVGGYCGGGGPPLPQGPSSTCVGSKRGACPEPGAGAWGQGSAGGVPLCTRGAGGCGLVRLGQMGEEVTTPSDSMAGGSGPSSLGAGLRHCRVLPSESAGDVGTFLWALPSLGQV